MMASQIYLDHVQFNDPVVEVFEVEEESKEKESTEKKVDFLPHHNKSSLQSSINSRDYHSLIIHYSFNFAKTFLIPPEK